MQVIKRVDSLIKNMKFSMSTKKSSIHVKMDSSHQIQGVLHTGFS